MTKEELIVELQSFSRYDSVTGQLIATKQRNNRAMPVGAALGTKHPRGYLVLRINKTLYKVHRLIWLLEYGDWPKQGIDHIDGNALNNKLENLRDISQAENLRNRRMSRNNTSGVCGVVYHKRAKLWHAKIEIEGKLISLGYFKCLSDAASARTKAEKEFGFSSRHGTYE